MPNRRRTTAFAIAALAATAALAAEGPIDRWAQAVGGRDRVAPIRAVYREATIEVGTFKGWLKVWHTADGTYRKEEQVGPYANVEIFDGSRGSARRGAAPAQPLPDTEISRARSNAYSNWNAVFFAFFPERRHGDVVIETDGTIVLKPKGGIDWRVTLDPQTSLPKRMVHQEGERTVTVDLVAYETVDGVQLEKEIHRSNGDSRFDAVIRFTKTVLNPPLDAALFTPEAAPAAPAKP